MLPQALYKHRQLFRLDIVARWSFRLRASHVKIPRGLDELSDNLEVGDPKRRIVNVKGGPLHGHDIEFVHIDGLGKGKGLPRPFIGTGACERLTRCHGQDKHVAAGKRPADNKCKTGAGCTTT